MERLRRRLSLQEPETRAGVRTTPAIDPDHFRRLGHGLVDLVGDHAATYVERAAVRWLVELIGFRTDGSMGLLTSGASVATLIGLAAARHRAAAEDGWNEWL